MSDPRVIAALQTTLFRMTHDPEFCEDLFAGRGDARLSTGLSDRELAPLLSAPKHAYSADRGGRRLEQFLHNVSSELRVSCALAPATFPAGFVRSPHFHNALCRDRALPLAFADYAENAAEESGHSTRVAVARLEAEMVRARREPEVRDAARECDFVLSPWARILSLPVGTTDRVAALRDTGNPEVPPPAPTEDDGEDGNEAVLLIADAISPAPGALRALQNEILSDVVAVFLGEAAHGQREADWPDFAHAHNLEADDVVAVARSFVEEGVLVRPTP